MSKWMVYTFVDIDPDTEESQVGHELIVNLTDAKRKITQEALKGKEDTVKALSSMMQSQQLRAQVNSQRFYKKSIIEVDESTDELIQDLDDNKLDFETEQSLLRTIRAKSQ